MLAMTLLLIDFALLPVFAVALIVLIALYGRSWSAWRAAQHGEAE